MNTLDRITAALTKAEAGGVHGAGLAALRRRLRQLGEQQAGLLPGEVLDPLPDLPRLDELLSLRRCRRFEVEGDVTFGAGVVAVGEVRMVAPRHVPDGEVLGG